MTINLTGVSKRFNYDWIFSRIDYSFSSGDICAITGPNGSGKSTLLRIIAGQLSPSEGVIDYQASNRISREEIFKEVAFSAPYLDLPDDFSLEELVRFHGSLKPFKDDLDVAEVIRISGLEKDKHKALKYYSSGMKQRVRNTLAILSRASILILDEPTSHLDQKGCEWYTQLLQDYSKNRVVLIGSNQAREYTLSNANLDVGHYKQRVS